MSLRPKFLYLLVLVMMAVTVLFAAYGLLDTWRTRILQRKAVAELAARIISGNLEETGDVLSAARASVRELSHLGVFKSWAVTDTNMRVLHIEGVQETPEIGLGGSEAPPAENIKLPKKFLSIPLLDAVRSGRPQVEGGVVSIPIRNGGKIVAGFWGRLDPSAASGFFPSGHIETLIVVMILAMAFTILVVYTAISSRVLRPLEKLSEGARRVARGDYSIPVTAPGARGEVEQLVDVFNDMVAQIRESRTDLEDRVRDATEKVVERERQLSVAQRLSATGQLASGVAHEINNPLGGMMNAMKKLSKEDLSSAKKEEYLELVKSGLISIGETVNGLLLFAPRSAVSGTVNLRDTAAGAAALVEHYAAERDANLTIDVNNDYHVNADEGELKQVFLNLLMNAVDAVDRGGNVTVRATGTDDSVTVYFEDDGKGMTQDEVSKALELFYTTKERGRGSGLGLPIVVNIVEKYKGEIRIDSRPDGGTTVTIVFPIVPPEGSQ